MGDPNLILTITAADLPAERMLRLPHNTTRCLPGRAQAGEDTSGQTTPPLQASEDHPRRLQLTFDQRPKDLQRGFVFGTDPQACDVLLSIGEKKLSRQHFCITLDGEARLVLKGISRWGTVVSYNGQASSEKRKGFSWILFDEYKLKVHLRLNDGSVTIFNIELEDHRTCEAEYQAQLSTYLEESRNAIPPLSVLGIHSQMATAAPTQPLSPKQRPIYILGNKLGSGSFGTVYTATDVSTGELFAAKRFNLGSGFETEVEILKGISHEHIVQFVDQTYGESPLLIMEYLPFGNLEKQHSEMAVTKEESVQILLQGLRALNYLHSQNITHRDIKPENILVQNRGSSFYIKLADFGLSKNASFLKTFCGTPMYAAPEILSTLRESIRYDNRVDIWSLGMVVLQYARGLPEETRLRNEDIPAWYRSILQAVADTPDEPIFHLLRKMLQKDYRMRPSASECLKDAEDLLDIDSGSVTPTHFVNEGRTPILSYDVESGKTRGSGTSKRQRSPCESSTGTVSSSGRQKRSRPSQTILWRSSQQRLERKDQRHLSYDMIIRLMKQLQVRGLMKKDAYLNAEDPIPVSIQTVSEELCRLRVTEVTIERFDFKGIKICAISDNEQVVLAHLTFLSVIESVASFAALILRGLEKHKTQNSSKPTGDEQEPALGVQSSKVSNLSGTAGQSSVLDARQQDATRPHEWRNHSDPDSVVQGNNDPSVITNRPSTQSSVLGTESKEPLDITSPSELQEMINTSVPSPETLS